MTFPEGGGGGGWTSDYERQQVAVLCPQRTCKTVLWDIPTSNTTVYSSQAGSGPVTDHECVWVTAELNGTVSDKHRRGV